MDLISLIVMLLILSGFAVIYLKKRRSRQLEYIKGYVFHSSIKKKISNKYPHLSNEETHLVFRALRDYFWMCNKAKRRMVAMPSQVVDDAWHEFILFTRNYEIFCSKSIGRFLHHTPTEAMRTPTLANEGIKRAWRLACAKENIHPSVPFKLPLIFEIDSKLKIEKGFIYSLDCTDRKTGTTSDGYCAGHIGCSSGCTGDSGVSSDSGVSNDSGGFFDGFFDSTGADCGGGCGGD